MKSLSKLFPRLASAAPIAATVSGLKTRTRRSASVDVARIADTIERALAAGGIDPRSGSSVQARDTIQSALRSAGVGVPPDAPPRADADRIAARDAGHAADAAARSTLTGTLRAGDRDTAAATPAQARGTSIERRFGNAAGTRAYALYVPSGHDPLTHAALPLVVMLHGCTQSPADFATGTRMNALADRHGVLVAWPEQTARDNGSRCWNWFRREDQARGAGEPSILAGIVGDIAADHRVDLRRVYAAGLSAGAGMAIILGRTYPDVFAAVGAHSGLPFAAAHDVPSAFSAMQAGGALGTAINAARREPQSVGHASQRMPTIVFHGNADRTVHQRNGTAIVTDAVAEFAVTAPLTRARSETAAGDGRAYTRETFADDAGHARVEHWVIHGAGHAWSGGDAAGSYTDPAGPDASEHMLRFFLQHAH